MKTFKQYYLNEAYYQFSDEDLIKITNYIYNRFKKMIIEEKYSDNFNSLWEYNKNEKKPKLIEIKDDFDEINVDKKIPIRFFLIINFLNYIDVYGKATGNKSIVIYLNILSLDHFIKNDEKVKFKIKDFLIHEFTHIFDNLNYGYYSWLNKFIKLKYKLDKLDVYEDEENFSTYRLKQYRTDEETNAMIHQLIYGYKQLQKENYPNLENISLFELINKIRNPLILNFVLSSSLKLQKYYIRRLNKEGIPIRRIGTPPRLGKINWVKTRQEENFIRSYIFDKETKNKIDSLMKYPKEKLEMSLRSIIKTKEDLQKLKKLIDAIPSKYGKLNDFYNKISKNFY